MPFERFGKHLWQNDDGKDGDQAEKGGQQEAHVPGAHPLGVRLLQVDYAAKPRGRNLDCIFNIENYNNIFN
jgi:hypothetical protein